jgi:hypothetical protein
MLDYIYHKEVREPSRFYDNDPQLTLASYPVQGRVRVVVDSGR